MLKLNKVTKNFGTTQAVRGISFELKNGDVAGLLGPNGAGKTTTMRMITSYYYPTSGSITIDGQDTVENTIETQAKIGYLPENNPLYTDMLVVDYLAMSAGLQGVNQADIPTQIKKAASEVGINDKLITTISELSKGYRQRVGIASALIHNPKLLILDEPTEGLDPNQRAEIRSLIQKLSKDKVILISTHVMQEVKAMCNKIILINEGKVVTQGSPETITGIRTLRLRIEGSKIGPELEKLINKKEKEYVKIENPKDKVKKVYISSNKELQYQISKLAQKNNWTIWEISVEDNLEDVFRNLK